MVPVFVSVGVQEGEMLCVIDGKDAEWDQVAVLEVEQETEGETVGEADRGDREMDAECVLLYDGLVVEDQVDDWVSVRTTVRLLLQVSVWL